MIECQAQRHLIASHDLILNDDRFASNSPQAENGRLRQVDDRREGVDAE